MSVPDGLAMARRRSRAGSAASEAHGTSEAGSATIYVLALTSVLVTVGVTLMAWAGAVAARHAAASAADLAALAAAEEVSRGSGSACAAAAEVAQRSRGVLEECRVAGTVVDVTVAVAVRWPAAAGPARARSRAGPEPGGTSPP